MRVIFSIIGLGILGFNTIFITPVQADCVTPPAGLVSWWRGEGNADDFTSANNGTLLGATTFALGNVGQGFVFDGNIGTGVALGNPTNLQLQNFTIEGWVKRSSATVATLPSEQVAGLFFSYGSGGYGFGVWNDGTLILTRVGYDGVTFPNLLTDTNWHHVALVKDGTSVVVYVDGTAFAAPAPYSDTFTFNSNVAIGARGDNLEDGFLGSVDEISVYARPLSSNEIAAIYAAGSAGKCITPTCTPAPTGLVGWWPGEGNGNDLVGGNNGTLLGTTTFAPGNVGQGFVFDGNNGTGVSLGNPTNLQLQNFTIEGWVKRSSATVVTASSANTAALFCYGYGGYGFALFNDGSLFLTRVGIDDVIIPNLLTDTNWHHVALVKDGTSVVIYMDGTAHAAAAPYLSTFTFDSNVAIGARGDNLENVFLGSVDEFSIYARPLSSNEIAAIYNAGSAGKCDDKILINVDFGNFGAQASAVSPMSGLAATGKTTNDFWNAYSRNDGFGGYLTFGTLSNLATSDGTVSAVGFTISDAPGDWGNGSSDLMYNDFLYSFDGGNPVITLTNLPAGLYDLYLYSNDGNLDVTVGSTDYGVKTALDNPVVNPPVWQEGKQYVRFHDLAVGAGQVVSVSVQPGTSYPGFISGLQILAEVPTAPAILTQPASQTVAAGNTTSFGITAITTSPLSYQWTYNQTNIPGATNATLTLTNLHANQSGNYQVSVINAYGTNTSSIATLKVVVQNILAYNYSGNETVIATGLEATYKYSGQMIFIPASTNGTFIGWGAISGKKQYWISPFSSNLLLFTIPSRTNHVYTVFGEAGQAIDTNGYPNLWFNLHTGLNKVLIIGNKLTFSFPNIFACDESHVYPDAKTGNMILTEASSIYMFSPTATQTANNNGQTMIDLVNAQIKSLLKQGYHVQ